MDLQASELALLEKLRAANIQIPPRPQILQDIETMLDDDDATERMIGQLIARDVGLTAEVFRLANSPFYRRGANIQSVEQAVRILGRKAMAQVTRSALLRQQLGTKSACMESFWERCTDVATLCSVLCDQLERPGKLCADEAYLIGLFHDSGVPVLMQHIEDYGKAQFDSPTGPDFLEEDDARGTSHCIAGLMVAMEWHLPDMLCEAIRGHHYVIAEDHPAPHSVALLQLALHAYNRLRGWPDNEWGYQAERALAVLAIAADDLDRVLDQALASFEVLH
ncbi:MAG: HDOD domain-containing protein [Burkholderiales bacterium]|nr:HDOD domain-containing protein [Burkholderiales bacterium]